MTIKHFSFTINYQTNLQERKNKLNYVILSNNVFFCFLLSVCTKNRTIRESSLPKARIDFGADLAEHSLSEARSRAHRAITEETVFDSKGFKVPKIGIPLKSEIENNFDGEVSCFDFDVNFKKRS